MRALGVVLLLAACDDSTVIVGGLHEVASFPATPNRDLDILFVVDNSSSMFSKQLVLAASFPKMMDVLSELDGGLPNVHIGVVTSDMGTSTTGGVGPAVPDGGCANVGDDGVLQHANAPTLIDSFISDVATPGGQRERNYTGELRDVFAQIATVGDDGCGFEQHLAAMQRALTHPANDGFLRAHANLAVIIVADEDDCSASSPAMFDSADMPYGALGSFRCARYGIQCDPDTLDEIGVKQGCTVREASPIVEHVQPFVDRLIEVKGDPRKVLVAAIVGDPTHVEVQRGIAGFPLQLAPSCIASDATALAFPAVRLSAFLDAFPGRSQLTSICSDDLTTPLAKIGNSAKKLVGDPCIDDVQLVDSSSRSGLQPACEVVDIRDSSSTRPTTIPSCETREDDCYELVPDATACPSSPEQLRVRIRRSRAASDDTWTHVRCQVQSD